MGTHPKLNQSMRNKLNSTRRKRLARPAFFVNALNGNVSVAQNNSGNWLRNMTYRDQVSCPRQWMIQDAEAFFNRGMSRTVKVNGHTKRVGHKHRLEASTRRCKQGKATIQQHQALLSRTPFSPTQSLAHHLALVGLA